MITHLSYEWGCLPDEVERQSSRYQATMLRYLRWRNTQQNKQQRRQ